MSNHMLLNSILSLSVSQNASDLHLSSGAPPCIRVNGQLVFLSDEEIPPIRLKNELFILLSDEQKDHLSQYGHLDFAYNLSDIDRFRVNIFYQQRGISAVFRVINHFIPNLSQLGAPDIFIRLTEIESGIILVTGATGSGKSTTLSALIQHINMTHAKHIITLEDPIECIYKNEKSLIQQREVSHFGSAIDSILRQDPDIILLGELRNKQAIKAALTAAETGHLVLATLHTRSAIQTIHRIIDVFEGSERDFIRTQLASSLKAIISQKLVADNKGRKALFEILINTPAVSNLINEGKIKQIFSLMQTGQQYGMQIMSDK